MDAVLCGSFSSDVTFCNMGLIMQSKHVQFGCQMSLDVVRFKDRLTVFVLKQHLRAYLRMNQFFSGCGYI